MAKLKPEHIYFLDEPYVELACSCFLEILEDLERLQMPLSLRHSLLEMIDAALITSNEARSRISFSFLQKEPFEELKRVISTGGCKDAPVTPVIQYLESAPLPDDLRLYPRRPGRSMASIGLAVTQNARVAFSKYGGQLDTQSLARERPVRAMEK